MMTTANNSAGLRRLRLKYYNASVTWTRDVHEALRIIRVRPDSRLPALEAGQYVTLGMGTWEPCIDSRPEPIPEAEQLIRRAYSVSCSMLDGSGDVVRVGDCDYLEFYIALVANSDSSRPKLTPRLFHLQAGDRLYVSPHAHGRYSLAAVKPTDRVIFVATGTGEAPQNAMLVELLAAGHAEPIVSLTCVRYRKDLAYLATHRELERRFPNYRYLPLTTREPENLDPRLPGYIGKQHVQAYFESGNFERASKIALDPARTHVYLCGNPAMVGLSNPGEPDLETGMVAVLQRRGFVLDQPDHPANLHCERFW